MITTHLVFFFSVRPLLFKKFQQLILLLIIKESTVCVLYIYIYNLFQCSRAGSDTGKGGQNSAHERN
jgi:hypothetical protein